MMSSPSALSRGRLLLLNFDDLVEVGKAFVLRILRHYGASATRAHVTTDAISLRCRVNEADLVRTEELRYRRGIANAISTIHAGVIR